MAKVKGNPPPKVKKVKRPLLERLDLPRIICIHLIGENHTIHHRMGVGLIIMSCGVLISRFSEGYYILHFVGDLVGFGIHGIGTIPFGEALAQHVAGAKNPLDIEKEVPQKEREGVN